jgi:hypothetical protein
MRPAKRKAVMVCYFLLGMTLSIGQVNPAPPPAMPPWMKPPGSVAQSQTPVPAPPELVVAPTEIPLPSNATPGAQNAAPAPNAASKNDTEKKDDKNDEKKEDKEEEQGGHFFKRLWRAYVEQFNPKNDKKDDQAEATPEPPRRALPSPWSSPPFPTNEYQGYPLIGVPAPTTVYPFMKAVYGANTPWSEAIKESRIQFTGWVTAGGNWSTARNSNIPTAYWIVPNRLELDQAVFKLERYADTVQTDHIDWGFRSIALFGIDYRYTTAGGWGSEQLLNHNLLNGWDPVEQYFNVYIPGFLGGTDIRVGRWIACPDIETQYSVDNYLATHSLLFTYDTYTQTGILVSQKINDQWMVQNVLHAGTDMAPWYKGSLLTYAGGIRWVAEDNNNAFYTWLNAINSAKFRHFDVHGQPAGHDNFNYVVTTWEHRFNKYFHTKTESYFMWQRDAELGGTPSIGPVKPFGGGGGDGVLLPGVSYAYGVLNYTMCAVSDKSYFTLRNEWWKDERGMRSGFRGNYTSHTIGFAHYFNDVFLVRPEIGYYRNYNNPAFDLGTKKGLWLYGFDMTLRF